MIGPQQLIRLHPSDNVAIARRPIANGARLTDFDITVSQDIPAAHKVALVEIGEGEVVRRYGQIIGVATQPIHAGDHVHVQNLALADFERDYAFGADVTPVPATGSDRTFMGIVRDDGRVATRNYIGVISTVNCSATVVKRVAQHFATSGALDAYSHIDGIVPLSHSFGCCIDHHGEGLEQLRRTLAGFATHANFAAVLIIGLGCEANQLKPLRLCGALHKRNYAATVIMRIWCCRLIN